MARVVHEHQPARPANRIARYREVSCFRCECRRRLERGAACKPHNLALAHERLLATFRVKSAHPRRRSAALPTPARAQRNPHPRPLRVCLSSLLRARAPDSRSPSRPLRAAERHLVHHRAHKIDHSRDALPARAERSASQQAPSLTMQSAPARVKPRASGRPGTGRRIGHQANARRDPSRDRASSSECWKRDGHPRSART